MPSCEAFAVSERIRSKTFMASHGLFLPHLPSPGKEISQGVLREPTGIFHEDVVD